MKRKVFGVVFFVLAAILAWGGGELLIPIIWESIQTAASNVVATVVSWSESFEAWKVRQPGIAGGLALAFAGLSVIVGVVLFSSTKTFEDRLKYDGTSIDDKE